MTFGVGGWEPIKLRSNDRDAYLSAKAQGENNPSVFGMGQKDGEMNVIDQGIGDVSKANALSNKYGNPNVMTGDLLSGLESDHFSQGGDALNGESTNNPFNQSGSMEIGKSMTIQPQTSYDSQQEAPADEAIEQSGGMDTQNLEERLRKFAINGQGQGLNNAHEIYKV